MGKLFNELTNFGLKFVFFLLLFVFLIIVLCQLLRKYIESGQIKTIISGTSNKNTKEIEMHLSEFLFTVDSYNHILKSLYLFEEFRNLIYDSCTDLEIGKYLIKCFKNYEIHGTTSEVDKIKDLDVSSIQKNIDQCNFLYYLLETLINESRKKSNFENENASDLLENICNQTKVDVSDKNFLLKIKFLKMFPILILENAYFSGSLMYAEHDRKYFISTIVSREKNTSNIFLYKYFHLKKDKKTFHVFYVKKRSKNDPINLTRKDFLQLCNIYYNGYYKLKSFHAYWYGKDGLERISCYEKGDSWFSFDNDEILLNDAIVCLLCDGNCDIQLFYEEVE